MVSADDVNAFCEVNWADCRRTSGWYRLKLYLDHQGSISGGNENTVMNKLLPDVQNLIRDQMDAVGLIEQFSTTLALFNRTLDMPDMNWTRSFSKLGIHNAEREPNSVAPSPGHMLHLI